MAATGKEQATVLVIGTRHEYQRHQDRMPDREEIRAKFEELLRRVIEERSISHIAEEAGDDTEVWEHLKRQEDATPPELAKLFGGTEVVDEPQSTIAKQIADEQPAHLTHVDIRPPHAEVMTIEERDEAMAANTMEILGIATNMLVICGERHRAGVGQRIKGQGFRVESFCFP